MRKILLATTALVGVAFCTSGAHAAAPMTSPITVNIGGYVDAIAGFDHESVPTTAITAPGASGSATGLQGVSHDFETEFKINVDAIGKAANGIQYGANIGLWNGPEVTNLWTGGGSTIELNSAYVWLSGSFGKFLFGDEHGASDLFVYAPTVGEGQVDGRFSEFTSPFLVARFYPSGIDNTEHSTKITYYTPKVGNDDNKVQLGFSYAPQMYNYGQATVLSNAANSPLLNGVSSPYEDLLKGAIQYTGNFHPVSLTASAQIINGSGQATAGNTNPFLFNYAPNTATENGSGFRDFTAWGLGTQVGFDGFTLGASFMDNGSYGTLQSQGHDQHVWTFGGKYEFDKVSVGASWLNGKGYDNLLAGSALGTGSNNPNDNYVSVFNAYSVGATYTWFPGLTTAADGTIFTQDVRDQTGHNDGYVFLVSQKLTF